MKIVLIVGAVLLLMILIVVAVLHHPAFGRRPAKAYKEKISSSANYSNGSFQNEIPTPQLTSDKSLFAAMWEFLAGGSKNKTPREALHTVKTDLLTLPTDVDWLVWFGHSSYLFQLSGKRFLVDPLLKMEFPVTVMMKAFKGTDIYSPEDMPPIDYLIITHEHWDHLDYATLRDLRSKVQQVICPLGIADYLDYWGYEKQIIHEMDWGEAYADESVTITCLPTRHFSNRLFTRNQTLWASFMVSADERLVYIGGDGGYDERFKRIRQQFGQVDLALMENGQYDTDWANIHLLPEKLEQAVLDLDAKQVFTVHHDKFALAKHAWDEPDKNAQQIAQKYGVRILDKPIGEVVRF